MSHVDIALQNELYFSAMEKIRGHNTAESLFYPVDIPSPQEMWCDGRSPIDIIQGKIFRNILHGASSNGFAGYEGSAAIQSWLTEATVEDIHNIEDLISFNLEHEEVELSESVYCFSPTYSRY